MIWKILLFIIIGFNLFLIWSDSYNKQELKVINEIIEKYGASFNDDVLQQMEQDINDLVQEFGGTDAQSFFENLTIEQYEEVSLEKQQQINHASLLYTYLQSAKGLESRYATIDIPKLKQIFITEENLPAWLEQKMTDDFDAYEIELNENFVDMPLLDLNLRTKYDINILVVKRGTENIIPSKDTVLKARDHLFIFGRKKDINKVVAFFEQSIY